MPGVPRELVEHALNMDLKARLVKQPLQRFDEPKHRAISAELHHLEDARFIKRNQKIDLGLQSSIGPQEEHRCALRMC
jgi:hypothetical protein